MFSITEISFFTAWRYAWGIAIDAATVRMTPSSFLMRIGGLLPSIFYVLHGFTTRRLHRFIRVMYAAFIAFNVSAPVEVASTIPERGRRSWGNISSSRLH